MLQIARAESRTEHCFDRGLVRAVAPGDRRLMLGCGLVLSEPVLPGPVLPVSTPSQTSGVAIIGLGLTIMPTQL